MSGNITEILPKLLDSYLEELKGEAETVAHIAKFLEKSTASRNELVEELKSKIVDLNGKPSTKTATAPTEIASGSETKPEIKQDTAQTH